MKKITMRSLIVWAAIATSLFFSAAPVLAQSQETINPTCSTGEVVPITLGVSIAGKSQVSGLGEYINTAYRYLASVVLVVAIVMVVYGGFLYLLGSANVGNIQRGKQIIKDALIGMVVVLAAFAILNTVNSNTTRFTLNPEKVECIAFDAGNPNPSCESDANCSAGQKCVQTSWRFSPQTQGNFSESIASGAQTGALGGAVIGAGVGAIPGTILGAAGGVVVGFYQSFEGGKVCTDGRKDAPCGSTSDCKPNQELECSSDWHLCLMTGANPNGHPCDEDSYCTSNNCSGEAPKFCRGTIPLLTNAEYQTSGYRVPDNRTCFSNVDCSAAGGLCAGPANSAYKFCTRDSASSDASTLLGALCFLNSGGTAQPSACGGDPFTCMVCPPTGSNRKWQVLNGVTDPGKVRIGSCRNGTDVNTLCGGS